MHCEFCGRPWHLPSYCLVVYISMRKQGTQCVLWVGSSTLGNWSLPASVEDLQSKSMSRQRWILLQYIARSTPLQLQHNTKAFCEPLSMLVAAGPLGPHWGRTGPVKSAARSRVVSSEFVPISSLVIWNGKNHREVNLQHEYALMR